MLTYKMAFISDVWTSKVISRVLRDILLSQRLTRLDNVCLIAAANRDLSMVLRGVTKVKTTTDVSGCEIYRLYVDNSVPRADDAPPIENLLPEEAVDYEIIDVVPAPLRKNLIFEGDPYAGMNLPDRFARIPSTIDLMRRAPKPIPMDEPPYNPYR